MRVHGDPLQRPQVRVKEEGSQLLPAVYAELGVKMGTKRVARMAERLGYPLVCVGVPKTVDNDLAVTEVFQYTSNAGVTASLRVNVVDDMPVVTDHDIAVSQVPLPSYNLVLVLDISGSMEAYSRAYLQLLHSAVGGAHAEAFVFATRLTRCGGTRSITSISKSTRIASTWLRCSSAESMAAAMLAVAAARDGFPAAGRSMWVIRISRMWVRLPSAALQIGHTEV